MQCDGTSITNFSSLVFDPDSQWLVTGNDLPGGLGALDIDGFAAGDTIDLTGFAGIGGTWSSNTLVVADGLGDFDRIPAMTSAQHKVILKRTAAALADGKPRKTR